MESDFRNDFYVGNEMGGVDTISKSLKFAYLCYYIDFVFYKTKRWQLSVPIQAGTGFAWWQTKNKIQWSGSKNKNFLVLYEPGISIQFKIFRWAGVGADLGYRFTAINSKKIGEKLNSPTYSFKALIWFDYIYYCLFPNSKITKRFGPAVW